MDKIKVYPSFIDNMRMKTIDVNVHVMFKKRKIVMN